MHGRSGFPTKVVLFASAIGVTITLHPMASPAATLTTLYSFCKQTGCPDGSFPLTGLVMDSLGNLFGTTGFGGAHDCGTIFELVRIGSSFKHQVLYNFCSLSGQADGNLPFDALTIDADGNLYGTTQSGPGGFGVAFKLNRRGTPKLKVLHRFCTDKKCTNGVHPVTRLHYKGETTGVPYDGVSSLFGSAQDNGGSSSGIVFRLEPEGAVTTLHNFCKGTGCADGLNPSPSREGLLVTPRGDIIGTTARGGAKDHGMAFEISHLAVYGILSSFCQQTNCTDGDGPIGPLAFDGRSVWGTTKDGGAQNRGVVFRLRGGVSTVRHSFCSGDCSDGAVPGGITADAAGHLFGATVEFGTHANGTIYKFDGGSDFQTLYNLCTKTSCRDGEFANSQLVIDASGNLFGTTEQGGAGTVGTVFELTP